MNGKTVKEILVSALALAIIGGTVTAALAVTNELTQAAIAARTAEEENQARRQVIDADTFERATLQDAGEEVVYYTAEKDGQAVGYVFTASVTGKSSGLVIMTGIRTDGTVSGVAVTENNETAGYVDKVTQGGLLDAFVGKPADTFVLGTNIDGVSQATKTSKGVVTGVNQAVTWYREIAKGGDAS